MGGERMQPDHPAADLGRGEVPPGSAPLEAGRGHHVPRPGDVVQPAAVGVNRYGAVAQPGPHPRRRSPATVPARARVATRNDCAMRIRHEGLRALAELDHPTRLPLDLVPRLRRILNVLDEAQWAHDIDARPGYRLHLSKGGRATATSRESPTTAGSRSSPRFSTGWSMNENSDNCNDA